MSRYSLIVTLLGFSLLFGLTACDVGESTDEADTDEAELTQLDEYEIEKVAGIRHLRGPEDMIVYPAFCPTACTAAWAKPTDVITQIGAVRVDISEPGTYTFDYYIEPLVGDFFDLEQLQVVVLPDEEGVLSESRIVERHRYAYTRLGQAQIQIPSAGTYIIGFGPSEGSALTELEAQGIPSGFHLKYQLQPSQQSEIVRADMDIVLTDSTEEEIEVRHIEYQEYEEMTRQELKETGWGSASELVESGISEQHAEWLANRGPRNALVGGANLEYPLGRNEDYVLQRLNEFQEILPRLQEEGIEQAQDATTAKIYNALLTYREDAEDQNIEFPDDQLRELRSAQINEEYEEFLSDSQSIVKGFLGDLYPEWQDRSL